MFSSFLISARVLRQSLSRLLPLNRYAIATGLIVLAAAASFSGVLSGEKDTLRLSPVGVTTAAGADPAVFSLTDRDTGTSYRPSAAQQVIVALDAPTEIRSLNVFGSAAYVASVQAESGGGWIAVEGLQNLNLFTSPQAWNSFAVTTPVITQRLRVDLVPAGDSAGESNTSGLREIEFWGVASRTFTGNGQPLVAALNAQNLSAQGRSYAAIQQAGTIGSASAAADDSSDNQFAIDINASPLEAKRAYLVYEVMGLSHWTSAIRSINGKTAQGDWLLARSENWSTQIEKINPAWLVQGRNTVVFSQGMAGVYSVRNMRIVTELDDGTNFVERVVASGGAAQAVYDGDVATGWAPYAASHVVNGAATLDAYFDKPTQVAGLKLNISGVLTGTVGIAFLQKGVWTDANYTALNAGSLQPGWNSLPYPSSFAAEGVRLSFRNGASVTGDIRELMVLGSGVGPQAGAPSLQLSYPDNGQFNGRQAYIRGFATPVDKLNGVTHLYVGGSEVEQINGAFGVTVSKEETGFSAQADQDAWSVEVRAVFADATEVRRVVQLNRYSAPVILTKDSLSTLYSKVPPGKARKLAYSGAELDIGADALSKEVTFGMTPLNDGDIPPLNAGMTNVTRGPSKGYRFTPHGAHFKNKIKVTLPFNRAALRAGQTEKDIGTYYFDEEAGRWMPLERAEVNLQKGVVVSYTNHFTDMINATVTVPDHPNAASLNPTSIKDLKAADPGAQINLIEPPKANSMGDARLGYPIELPPGRNGMQPALSVQYNSGGGNGWMGMGWDIAMQSVSIDTRWGVPRYDAKLETESYVLDGAALTPVVHRGELKPRSTDKTFHTRIEEQFRRIVRHGNKPDNYWWEVTDKNGTRFYYGGNPEAGKDHNAVLADPGNGNIFRWALKEVRDTNGNNIVYQYDVVTGGRDTSEPWRQIYLQRIYYTGTQGGLGPYQVSLSRSSGRGDVMIDGRAGFKTVMDQRLTGIDVSLSTEANPLIRRYRFDYVTAAFQKSLLTRVTQYGEDGITEFNNHRFDYYDEARDAMGNYLGFAAATDWGIGNDNVSAGLLGKGNASAIGGNKGQTVGGHFYAGVGGGLDASSKNLTGGFKVGYGETTNETVLALADMNGDGLADKVFRSGGGIVYRPNLSGPRGAPTFGDPVPLQTLPAISREKVTSTTVGGELYFGLPVMKDFNRSTTRADTYFTDVNGDGLIDLVSGGRTLFGYVNAAGVPVFTDNSADTPVAVGTSAVNADGLLDDIEATAIESDYAAKFPLLDTVRRWVAPYDGVVQLDAPVQLLQDKSAQRAAYDGADGVRVAIQLEDAELWSARIAADDYAPHAPTGVETVPVRRGDRIYFRVQSVADGAYDKVLWDAHINYLNSDAVRTDVNALPVYRFQAASDFTLAGRKVNVTAPLTGMLRLSGQIDKTAATTDDVTLVVSRNGSEVYRRTLSFADSAVADISADVPVTQGDVLTWRVLVDSPIDVTRVRVAPTAFYLSADGVDRVTDDEGNYVVRVQVPFDMDLYPVSSVTAPQGFYKATADGVVSVQANLRLTGLASAEKASAVFTVKRRDGLLAKQQIDLTGNGGSMEQLVTADVSVKAGDELFFDLSSRDPRFILLLSDLNVTANNITVPVAVHVPDVESLFPQAYRGWSVVGYNGNAERAMQPIQQADLMLTDQYDPQQAHVYPFMAVQGMEPAAPMLWGGVDAAAWVNGGEISASRLGLDDIRMPKSAQFAGAAAVSRISRSDNDASSVAVVSYSKGNSKNQLDFQDMNGDRFPDVIGGSGVQYSAMTGTLEPVVRNVGLGASRESKSETFAASTTGGNITRTIANARGLVSGDANRSASSAQQGMDMSPLGFSVNIGRGTSDVQYELIDINGDGLPDKVYQDGRAALNLGYRFAAAEPWGGGIINSGVSLDAGGGLSLGFNRDHYSWGGGLSLTIGQSKSNESYVDLNGDGLPDKIVAGRPFMVRLNTGTGFTAPMPWPTQQDGEVSVDKHIALGGGAFFTFGFSFFGAKIVFNPGVHFSSSMGRPEFAFRDMDGDGYVDYVASDKDNALHVGGNFIGRTNLLKRITRPLGAIIELEYQRDGNTTNQPHSKWVLAKTTVHDGHVGDGVDKLLTTYTYEDAYYDRAEREFYGYASVTETQRDTTRGEAAYRRHLNQYSNRSYYTKGLLLRAVLENGTGQPYTQTKNQYTLAVVADNAAVPGDESRSATVFPQLIRTDMAWYEGQSGAGKQTTTLHQYDAIGNVIEFFDAGDAGADDDVRAVISYSQDAASYIVGKPTRIIVEGAGRVMRSREALYAPGTGNLQEVRQYLGNGQAAITNLSYHANGTLQSVLGPVNHRGQRYQLDYRYDPVVATHITGITDSFGLNSTAAYHFKYGRVTSSTDTNGNPMETVYDAFGRAISISGPYQAGSGQATLRFEYHPEAQTPWALTRHLDIYRNAADPIDTVLFTDGLKRVLQTKKDISVHSGPNSAPVDVMSVSGRIEYDAFGRAVAQSYPVTEPLGRAGLFNETVDAIAPTRTDYDVLDRVTRVTLPDNTVTSLRYGFGTDRNGILQFQTVTTDANGKQKSSYRDVQEQITAVQEFNQGQSIWTSYAYDPLKQIVAVRDDRGNLTQAQYDQLGRRIALDNPDTGLTTSEFDLAGNLVSKVTANLRQQNKAIRYSYDHSRLINVSYPNFPGNDIRYSYGAPNAPYNRAGRITDVTDQSGREERFYGKLGETVKEIRTIASKTQGNSTNSPEVWTTDYLFDTFGRLQRLVYPDGEVLTYAYDAGGNLRSTQGSKQGQQFNYLTRLEYDLFEQRAFLSYGNGISTRYSYHAQNRRLATLEAGSPGSKLQDLRYRYDNVGNILGLQNTVPVASANSFGGPSKQSYGYDDLYRLTQAEGSYDFAPNKRDQYSLSMAYDSIHNITAKQQQQQIIVPGGQAITQKKTSYDWTYDYNSPHPHAATHLGERSYRYDANGNQLGWDHDGNGTRRNIVWDDDNRIQSVFDNGHEMSYVYDDQGERVIKRGPQGETAYVNQWFTVRNRSIATKHVWAGTTRIASSLVPGVQVAGSGTSNWNGNGKANVNTNANRNNGNGSNGNGSSRNQSNFLSYYHPDHLGSSSYVSDANGKVTEHLEYFAFGETWVEENSNTQRTPYLFTAKELDEETGLYYFGARYYDPRTSVWQSPDPILHLYVEGGGNNGVYRSGNLGLYSYSYQNPIIFSDPDGNIPVPLITGAIGAAVGTAVYAGRQLYVGEEMSWKGAGIAAGTGFAFGSGAALLPGATAVAGAGLTGYAAGNLAQRAPDYVNMSAKEKRAFQADAVLTAAGAVGTVAQGARAGATIKDTASFSQIKTALTSAQETYKGSTVAGHALSKHAGRNPEIWGEMTGSMKTWNDQAITHFRDIARGPGEFGKVTQNGISFLEKRLSDGRGMRLNMDGTFKGFID